jgi:hypothetical protein
LQEDGTPSPTEEFEAALMAYLNAKTPEDEGGERRGEVDAETSDRRIVGAEAFDG